MKVNFDTNNWFKDRNFTVIVIILILTIVNTILSCIALGYKCPSHEMTSNFSAKGVYHTMMIRK